jgi:hypothetical protein
MGDYSDRRGLVLVHRLGTQLERNGAKQNPFASTPQFALDIAVVVIDGMTRLNFRNGKA